MTTVWSVTLRSVDIDTFQASPGQDAASCLMFIITLAEVRRDGMGYTDYTESVLPQACPSQIRRHGVLTSVPTANTMSNPDDPDWVWSPNAKSSWSLDVVNLLVVIGESSIAEHAQVITASLPDMLPRILPAPY
ncbi:hypothetical protein C2857_002494 [Epichloe festucae Fl1]|uniref:Uncharacterized protein n=1 Tax=Epichloe festucae (strain Fl1) TaxID=877507 RepID=A0A7U3Q041_EPIFF|nr:hypothetical protein C2857_002494 [Epichloe festucae Fl1]